MIVSGQKQINLYDSKLSLDDFSYQLIEYSYYSWYRLFDLFFNGNKNLLNLI